MTVKLCSAIAILGLALPAAASDLPYTISTHGGITIKSNDGQSKARISGRLMWDTDIYDGVYNAAGNGGTGSETELRRARLAASGVVNSDWAFDFSINVADAKGEATINSAFIAYDGWDHAQLTLGRFKRPFGLEQLTSSNWTTTIERSSIWDVVPAVNVADFGAMLSGNQGDFGWAVGLFDDGNEEADTGNDTYGINGRLTWAPIAEDERVLHFGLAYGDQRIERGTLVDVASRLGVHTIGKLTMIDDFPAQSDQQWGLEGAWLRGDLSVQGEWVRRRLNGDGARDLSIYGQYVQLAWTLTGESRAYSRSAGAFSRVRPQGERGAIELVAKMDHARISQNGASDQDFDVLTVGLTWWANRNVRMMINYLTGDTRNITGDPDEGEAVTTRLQFSF